jgi:hypothetical protein
MSREPRQKEESKERNAVPMTKTASPALTKDTAVLTAIVSFNVPGGPDISRTCPLFKPPESNLSMGGQDVEKTPVLVDIDAID